MKDREKETLKSLLHRIENNVKSVNTKDETKELHEDINTTMAFLGLRNVEEVRYEKRRPRIKVYTCPLCDGLSKLVKNEAGWEDHICNECNTLFAVRTYRE